MSKHILEIIPVVNTIYYHGIYDDSGLAYVFPFYELQAIHDATIHYLIVIRHAIVITVFGV